MQPEYEFPSGSFQQLKRNFRHKTRHSTKNNPTVNTRTLTIDREQHNKDRPYSKSVITMEFDDLSEKKTKVIYLPRKAGIGYWYEQQKGKTVKAGEKPKCTYPEVFKESINCTIKNFKPFGPIVTKITTEQELVQYPFCKKNPAQTRDKISFPGRDINRPNSKSTLTQQSVKLTEHYQKVQSIRKLEYPLLRQDKHVNHSTKKKKNNKGIDFYFPMRKPSLKKDYFVFGLNESTKAALEDKIENYRDLLWKLNYSNSMYISTPLHSTTYKVYIGPGNNSNLIRGIIKRRFWWVEVSTIAEANFVWTQLKINNIFSSQENTLKPESGQPVNSLVQPTKDPKHLKIFGKSDYQNWVTHVSKNPKTQQKINEHTYSRRSALLEHKKVSIIEDSKNILIHNHLDCNYYIGNKKALYYNLSRYLRLQQRNPFDILPVTFHLEKGIEDPEYKQFLTVYEKMQNESKDTRNIWIVKPGENTNQGNGITICYNLDDIKIRLNGRERNHDGKLRTFILQKYIENPFLYQRRKFDIRHYMLLTCINGQYKAYWYEEGYIRTSSTEFTNKVCRDPLVHLTNDAIQKKNQTYGRYQKANKLSYLDFQKYLDSSYPTKNHNFYLDIMPKMKAYAMEVFRSSYAMLDPQRRKHNFELLGLDFMIDGNFQPYLIEVNTNPCLEMCCPLMNKLMPQLLENTFRICVDPLFPPPEQWTSSKKTYFSEDSLAENKFEIIFDEASEGKEIQTIFQGVKVDERMAKIEEENQVYDDDGIENWEKNAL